MRASTPTRVLFSGLLPFGLQFLTDLFAFLHQFEVLVLPVSHLLVTVCSDLSEMRHSGLVHFLSHLVFEFLSSDLVLDVLLLVLDGFDFGLDTDLFHDLLVH